MRQVASNHVFAEVTSKETKTDPRSDELITGITLGGKEQLYDHVVDTNESIIPVILIVDEWIYKRLALKFPYAISSVRYDYCNRLIAWRSDHGLLESFFREQGFIKIKLNREIVHLIEVNEFSLTSRFKILNTDLVLFSSFANILEDITKLSTSSDYGCLLQSSNLIEEAISRDIVSHPNDKNSNENNIIPRMGSSDTIQQIDLTLNRLQTSFLIGFKGQRIEAIKKRSAATIKIMPIPHKLNKIELDQPNKTLQQVRVTGTLQQLHIALVLAEQHLRISSIHSSLDSSSFF